MSRLLCKFVIRLKKFIIEDELHAEWQNGEFSTFEDAVVELRRRAGIPWDVEPNRAPCTSWNTCGRTYEIIEFDTTGSPWAEVRRVPVLNVSKTGVEWLII